jgi:hypothetical protein
MENIPGMKWVIAHPRISAWVVLSVGMVGLLVYEARNVGLLPTQWIALIVTTILVAGACIWIISWEDEDDPEDLAEASTMTDDKSKEASATTS